MLQDVIGQGINFQEFPINKTIAPNPGSLIYEHSPIARKVYPPGATVWNHLRCLSLLPLDLQQLMGLICSLNVVLPWDRTMSKKTFQTKDILLEALEDSPKFQDYEQSDYGLELIMKLFTYREENRSRKASFRRIQRLNTHLPFRLRSQFSCLATSKTWFQITIDKRILYQNTNCYKSKKLLVEEDEDASPTRYVKAHKAED